jgi:hypothetical protein
MRRDVESVDPTASLWTAEGLEQPALPGLELADAVSLTPEPLTDDAWSALLARSESCAYTRALFPMYDKAASACGPSMPS